VTILFGFWLGVLFAFITSGQPIVFAIGTAWFFVVTAILVLRELPLELNRRKERARLRRARACLSYLERV
jgi:hypothetical protein